MGVIKLLSSKKGYIICLNCKRIVRSIQIFPALFFIPHCFLCCSNYKSNDSDIKIKYEENSILINLGDGIRITESNGYIKLTYLCADGERERFTMYYPESEIDQALDTLKFLGKN